MRPWPYRMSYSLAVLGMGHGVRADGGRGTRAEAVSEHLDDLCKIQSYAVARWARRRQNAPLGGCRRAVRHVRGALERAILDLLCD